MMTDFTLEKPLTRVHMRSSRIAVFHIRAWFVAVLLLAGLGALHAQEIKKIDLSRTMGVNGRDQSVHAYVPADYPNGSPEIWLHFNGESHKVAEGWNQMRQPRILVVVNLGDQISAYSRHFPNRAACMDFLDNLQDALRRRAVPIDPGITRYWMSSFGYGYSAIREFLRHEDLYARTAMVILAEGPHANLRTRIMMEQMAGFVRFARDAANREKTMVISHSEFDPGNFASTTKTANHILNALQLTRQPVEKTDVIGERTSETISGNLVILGYAGNTPEDQLRHFQGLHLLMITGLTISLNP